MKRPVMPSNVSLCRPARAGGTASGGGHHHHGSKTSADVTAASGSNAVGLAIEPESTDVSRWNYLTLGGLSTSHVRDIAADAPGRCPPAGFARASVSALAPCLPLSTSSYS